MGEVPTGGFPVCFGILLHGNRCLFWCPNAQPVPFHFARSCFGGAHWIPKQLEHLCGSPHLHIDPLMSVMLQIGTCFESWSTDSLRMRISIGLACSSWGSPTACGLRLVNTAFVLDPPLSLEAFVAVVSHFNVAQYHEGSFHRPNEETDPDAMWCGYSNAVTRPPADGISA